MQDAIEIVPYRSEWTHQFEEEKRLLLQAIGEEAHAVEHVGSTSIPEQEAKPIIDIFVGVTPLRDEAYYSSLLDPENYVAVKTGMKDRHLFQKKHNGIWTHNIHILPYDGRFYLRNEILLRDYLRKHPELVRKYGELKRSAARHAGSRMEAYTKAKTEFIQQVVDAAREEKGLPLEDVWTNEPKR